MKQLLTLILICLTVTAVSQSIQAGSYTFGSSGNVTSFAYNGPALTGLTASALSKNGFTSTSGTDSFRGNDWPIGATNGSNTFTGTIDLTKYIEFTLTATAGQTFSNPKVRFDLYRSSTGPRQLVWRSSLNNFASNIAIDSLATGVTAINGEMTMTDISQTNADNVFQLTQSNLTTVTFRLYGFNAESITGTGGLQTALEFFVTTAGSGGGGGGGGTPTGPIVRTIGSIRGVNNDGVADSLNKVVRLRGVVSSVDFKAAGYTFHLQDATGGIVVYRSADLSNYTSPLRGDSLEVFGVLGQYNGLLQMVPDTINLKAQNRPLPIPLVVTSLTEANEGKIVRMNGLTVTTWPSTWTGTGQNIALSDGTNSIALRVVPLSGVWNRPQPTGTINVIGGLQQFDNSLPYTSGYQIFPSDTNDIIPVVQTNVSGIISTNTTWTVANSPYNVTNNLLVLTGVTLTIQPGVIVNISPSKTIQISGELNAIGTISDSIVFQNSSNGQPFGYIEFSDESKDVEFYTGTNNYQDGNILKYVKIKGGGSTLGNVIFSSSTGLIRNSRIVNSATDGIHIRKINTQVNSGGTMGGTNVRRFILIDSSVVSNNFSTGVLCSCYQYNIDLIFNHNQVKFNTGNGISTSGGDSGGSHRFTVFGNNISNNGSVGSAMYSGGDGYVGLSNGDQFIRNNTFSNNKGNGIRLRGNGTYKVSKNIINSNGNDGLFLDYATHIVDSNVVYGNSGNGIATSIYGSSTIKFNQILNNGKQAIYPMHEYGSIRISRNSFARNRADSTIVSIPNNNITTYSSFTLDSNNFGKFRSKYFIYNYRAFSSIVISPNRNFFNGVGSIALDQKIRDWQDNSSISLIQLSNTGNIPVNFAPSLPPDSVFVILGNPSLLIVNSKKSINFSNYRLYYSPTNPCLFIDFTSDTLVLSNQVNIANCKVTVRSNAATGCQDFFSGQESYYLSNLTAFSPISVSVNGSLIFCAGDSIVLTASGGSNYLWSTGAITSSIVIKQSGSYSVYGNSSVFNVTVIPRPTVSAGTDLAVCAGTTVTLSGSGASTYTWNNAVSNAVAFIPTATTTYTVTGTNTNGCVNTDQVVITVNPLPLVNAGTDLAVCAGTTVTLSGSGASTYTWNNAVSNAVAFIPTATTTYTVTGTNTNGCVKTDQVLVTVNSLPVVNAGSDITICAGTSVTLNGSGASTYTWNNAVSNAVAFTPTATTTYTVTGTDANSCLNTDQVVVTVNPSPLALLFSSDADAEICQGEVVSFYSAGAQTYKLFKNSTLQGTQNGATAVFSLNTINNNDTVRMVTTGSNGCSATSLSIIFKVNSLPTVSAGVDLTLCFGSSIALTATGASSYNWSTGLPNGTSFTPATTATYTVTGSDTNGCVNTDQVVVTVNALPSTTVTASNLIFCASDSSVIVAAGGQRYLWSTGDTTQSITIKQTGNYAVTVTTVNGCVGISNTLNITVVPDVMLPQILGDLYGWFASGDTVNFSVVNNGGYQLTWGIAGGQITSGQGGDTISVVWGAADSTAAIWVVVSNGVCQDSAYLNLVISGLGTGEDIGSKAMAYPNPNSGVFTLEWSNIDAQQVLIYNGVGQVVASQAIAQGTTSTVIDLSAKAAGIYRAVIYGIEGTVTLPVYVRH